METKLEHSVKVALKVFTILSVTAIGFAVGFAGRLFYFDHWVLPELVKQYPHDGQLGLEGFVESLDAGLIGAILSFAGALFWAFGWRRLREIELIER
jgi:hypothetical protein